ncbi:MAG: hypothetical protein OHK0017_01410 [Patescibacteria group bacterium]
MSDELALKERSLRDPVAAENRPQGDEFVQPIDKMRLLRQLKNETHTSIYFNDDALAVQNGGVEIARFRNGSIDQVNQNILDRRTWDVANRFGKVLELNQIPTLDKINETMLQPFESGYNLNQWKSLDQLAGEVGFKSSDSRQNIANLFGAVSAGNVSAEIIDKVNEIVKPNRGTPVVSAVSSTIERNLKLNLPLGPAVFGAAMLILSYIGKKKSKKDNLQNSSVVTSVPDRVRTREFFNDDELLNTQPVLETEIPSANDLLSDSANTKIQSLQTELVQPESNIESQFDLYPFEDSLDYPPISSEFNKPKIPVFDQIPVELAKGIRLSLKAGANAFSVEDYNNFRIDLLNAHPEVHNNLVAQLLELIKTDVIVQLRNQKPELKFGDSFDDITFWNKDPRMVSEACSKIYNDYNLRQKVSEAYLFMGVNRIDSHHIDRFLRALMQYTLTNTKLRTNW